MQTLIWVGIAIVLGIIEAITVDLVSIWFSIGALFAALLSYFQVELGIQIICFLILSLSLVFITRPLTKKLLRGHIEKTNSDRFIGDTAVVTTTIEALTPGEVKIHGQYWSAISKDHSTIAKSSIVEVLAIDGNKLVVEKTNS